MHYRDLSWCSFVHFLSAVSNLCSFGQRVSVLINCTYLWRICAIYIELVYIVLCIFPLFLICAVLSTVHICGGSVTEGQLPRTAAPEQMALDDDDDVFCVV